MRKILIRSALVVSSLVGLAGAAAAAAPAPSAARLAKATFAGGCFWCVEEAFDEVPGVVATTSGYTGGRAKNPSYEQVSSGNTGHAESVEVTYDPAKLPYAKLLDAFWHNIDPTDASGQFCDHGTQYRSAIFYRDEAEHRLAEESKRAVEKRLGKPVATQIVPASEFYPAEEYHQDFYKKNPVRYRAYRYGCGRDRRLEEIWGPPQHP